MAKHTLKILRCEHRKSVKVLTVKVLYIYNFRNLKAATTLETDITVISQN